MNSPFILHISRYFITQRQGLEKVEIALYNTTGLKQYLSKK